MMTKMTNYTDSISLTDAEYNEIYVSRMHRQIEVTFKSKLVKDRVKVIKVADFKHVSRIPLFKEVIRAGASGVIKRFVGMSPYWVAKF